MNRNELLAVISNPMSDDAQVADAQTLLEKLQPTADASGSTLSGTLKRFGESPDTVYFTITVSSEYAEDLLKTRTIDQAANAACGDHLLGSLRAKYSDAEREIFEKRFPDGCYKLLKIEKETA